MADLDEIDIFSPEERLQGIELNSRKKPPYPEGEDPTAYRWTGEKWVRKSQTGFLGPRIHKSTGATMTEYSIGNTEEPLDPDDPLRPSMVPTLTKEEIGFLTTLPEGVSPREWGEHPLGRSILEKSWDHYKMRVGQGLSPFLTHDEESPRHTVQQFQDGGSVDNFDVFDYLPSAGQAANVGGMFLPGSGYLDYFGGYATLPSGDQPFSEAFSGEHYPSFAENVQRGGFGGYFDAAMQGLGAAGDTMYALPLVGAVTGPTLGTGLKAAGLTGKLIKRGIGALSRGADEISALRAGESLSEATDRLRIAYDADPNSAKAKKAYYDMRNARDAAGETGGTAVDTGIGSLDVDTSYRGTHQPRGRGHQDAISLDNLTRDISGNPSGYPDDFYGPKGRQYYAPGPRFSGDEYGMANKQSYDAVLKARNNPDAEVTIYRAVPKGIDTVNEGDFVTLSPKYAEQHAASGYGLGGDEVGEVISQKVKVKDVLWAGDDINEFGYFPSPAAEIDQGIGALPRPVTAETKALIGDVPNNINIVPDTNLSGEMADIQRRFSEQLNANVDSAVADYARLPDSGGGRIVNTDLARELSPDYQANRSLSSAVHEPASAFTKEYYRRMLSVDAPPGKYNRVLFTGGGTGAGKTTALKDALLDLNVNSQIIYDTNMAGLNSSVDKIDQALDANKQVTLAYVYRDPIESLVNGAIRRAKRQESELGTGRTVPLTAHASTHARSNETMRELVDHYADNPNVETRIIDNSLGPGNAKDMGNDLSVLPRIDYNQVLKEGTDELTKAFSEGRISEQIYKGFLPD
tara:strand:- start:1718 stop:4123 length:2406 start_codon:yes stop_codon:yes gene_type:complete